MKIECYVPVASNDGPVGYAKLDNPYKGPIVMESYACDSLEKTIARVKRLRETYLWVYVGRVIVDTDAPENQYGE